MVTVEDLIEDVTATVSLEKLRALVQQFNARGNEIHYLQLLMGDRNRDIKQLRAALSQAKTMTFAGMDGFRTAFWEMAEAMNLAVKSGRLAYLSGRMPRRLYASASSPVEGVVR